MKSFIKLAAILIGFTGWAFSASSQTPDSSLNEDIRCWNGFARHRPAQIFLALDKQVYNPNENLLFTTYLLDKGMETVANKTLHITIVDQARGKIVAEDQFSLNAGLCTGSLNIPDSLSSGEYLVMAYTNAMAQHYASEPFKQGITIRAGYKEPFRLANISVAGSGPGSDSVRWHVKVLTSYNGVASGGQLKYVIRGDGKITQSGNKLINPFGEVDLSLPARDTGLNNMVLFGTVLRNKDSCQVSTPISLTPNRLLINFYPESGALIEGQLNRVGLTLHKADGTAVSTPGSLFADSVLVGTFRTDRYGFASVEYVPRQGIKYRVQLDHQPLDNYLIGELPPVIGDGVTLHAATGIVHDSLFLSVAASKPGGSYRLLVYSASSLIYAGVITLKRSTGRIGLETKDWPKGLARVVLLAQDNKTTAERTVYIAPTRIRATVVTDSVTYHQRSKVQVVVKVTDSSGRPLQGIFSFTSAMAARLRPTRFTDISLCELRDAGLRDSTFLMPPVGYFSSDAATDMVLSTGLSSYLSWKSLHLDTNRLPVATRIDNFGYVLHNEKMLKKPVHLLLMGPGIQNLITDSTGHFEIADSMLLAPLGANPVLSVLGVSNQSDYRIVVQNAYKSFGKQVAAAEFPRTILRPDTVSEDPEDNGTAPSTNEVKTLKAVVVRNGGSDDDIGGIKGCRDWVCMNDVLNCTNHPTGRKPVIGQVYKYGGKGAGFGPQMAASIGTIVYKECVSCNGCGGPDSNSFVGTVPAIHLPKDFYNVDSIKFSPTEPAIYSTLFWVPLVVTDKNGETRFFFFTNDVTGRFYNLVQGYSGYGTFKCQTVLTVVP